jgi:threonine dehydrogenase-like Zn-dependent dehydrogenase
VLAPGGRVVLVGLTPAPMVVEHSVGLCAHLQQIRGHYGSRPAHLSQLVRLTLGKRLDFSHSVSEVLPLREAPRGVDMLARKVGNPIRLVLKP